MTATPHPTPWRSGWYRPARRGASPNQGPRPAGCTPDLIVVHSISLPPGEYGTGAVQALFANRLDPHAHPAFAPLQGLQVSSHFLIDRQGVPWQFVSCDRRAWHAGLSHYRGRAGCNDDSIGIELEGLEGLAFEAAQYRSLRTLCRALRQRYPIRFIAGHEHIAPRRKGDPGAGFDWSVLWHDCAGSGIVLPPGTR